jgi:hypothetical protein
MGNYPWGPHGPQTGPNEVTPNPTPAYVPPPDPTPAYYPAPAPSYGAPAQGPVASGGGSLAYRGPIRPRPKGYFVALLLTFLFGPLGLFYATKKGALAMLLFLVGVPVALSAMGVLPFGSASHPFAVLDHGSVMDPMWKISAILSMLWAVIAVNRRNAGMQASS